MKELEERGIGRPSTYASIINTIQDREYVVKHGGSRGRFYPTEIGVVVCDLLVKNFPYIFDTAYTAKLEDELDDIEEGKEKWTDLLNGFYDHFEEELKDAGKKMENIKRMETDDRRKVRGLRLAAGFEVGQVRHLLCLLGLQQEGPHELHLHQGEHRRQAGPEHAGGAGGGRHRGVLRELRQGDGDAARAVRAVHGLPGLQRRSALQDLPQAEPEAAAEAARAHRRRLPACGKPLVLRQGAYGEFVSCSGYPKCKYVKQNLIEGMKCPKCGEGDLAERKARRGNVFWGCTNYPKCDFTSNLKPVAKKCPECGSPYLVEKTLQVGHLPGVPEQEEGRRGRGCAKEARQEGCGRCGRGRKVVCSYSKRIGDAPPPPTAETHGPVVEKKDEKKELQPA